MSTKRKLMLSLVGVALLTIAISSFAASASYSAGAIYKAYKFGSYVKPANGAEIIAKCTSLSYDGTISTSRNYHYGRPQDSTGDVLYASKKKVYKGNANGSTTFSLNADGQEATTFYFKVSNAHYVDEGNSTLKMTVAGTVTPG